MKPRITIYIVAFNAQKYLAQAIESVLAQTYRNFELLLVNDGSTDRTGQIMTSYPEDERIRYIYQDHRNFAAGMNRAITEAKGEYILGVDADDYIAEDYLEKMVCFTEKHQEIDYFYPESFSVIEESGSKSHHFFVFKDNEAIRQFILAHNFSPIPNPGSLKKRSLFDFDKAGLYKEVETCEDFDFLCRNVSRIRFKRVEGSSGYFYRVLPTSNSHKKQAREEVHARARKHLSAPNDHQMTTKRPPNDHQMTTKRPASEQSTPEVKTKILLCSPWDNCWLRYFKKYFGEKFEVRILKYKGWRSSVQDEGNEQIQWADVVFFMWSDAFLEYWSRQIKNGKKYIAYMRSYELWDTVNPWRINWNNVDDLIFVNERIRQCFLLNTTGNIKGFVTPTRCIPNAIDLDEWEFVDRKPDKNIAWVNDLSHKKGIQLLAQFAFSMPYDYYIFPAGSNGDSRSSFYFNYITSEMRIDHKISPIQRYDDVQKFLKDKSFSLNTSVVEGHTNALIEAMAVGIKPVIHNFPGAKDLFPADLVWNTVEEAIEILKGPYNSQEYRDYAEIHFDMNKVYKEIEDLF